MPSVLKQSLLEYQKITQQLTDPGLIKNASKLKALSRKHRELEKIIQTIKKIQALKKALEDNTQIIDNPAEDPELIEIAQKENQNLKTQLKKLKQQLEFLTIPRDPDDSRDIILEIRAGTGGDEAGLFAAQLFKMYSQWAKDKGNQLNIFHTSRNNLGGIKEIIAQITGQDVYSALKHESGVHRVQRIPETEKSGRIHTSTATVVILPKIEEKELEIKPEEIKIDTFRSSGPGGQSVNTTDSAIRLTHIPTGIVVTCQDEKSQHKNKAKAFSILRSRINQAQKQAREDKVHDLRSSQIGSGDRSEKIKTYNFPQDRLTDHRLKKSWHGLEKIINGQIDHLLKKLKQHELQLRKNMLQSRT
ncbi:MAG: peptide chain release factor 1 [Patescibacteria group bacterium]|nr:peptide chain release factor 1 [Patescibacteria group bacterium]